MVQRHELAPGFPCLLLASPVFPIFFWSFLSSPVLAQRRRCTTYTQPQNINAKSQLKTTPAEHASSKKWRSLSEQTPLENPFVYRTDAQRIHHAAVDHRQDEVKCAKNCAKAKLKVAKWKAQLKNRHVHQAHRAASHKEAKRRWRRETEEQEPEPDELQLPTAIPSASTVATSAAVTAYANKSLSGLVSTAKAKRARSMVHLAPEDLKPKPKEPVIIIDDVEEFDSGTSTRDLFAKSGDDGDLLDEDGPLEPRVLPLRPVPPNPYEDEEMSVVYAEQHSEIRLMCEVDLDISSSMWYKNGQVVHAMDRTSRVTDYRFIKEANGALTITNVMLEDDGKWQCEAENTRRYTENARPVKLVVLDRPKPPYLLIDSRRLDAGNIFVPVKENSELNLACVSEGGNPRPTLTWEVLLSPGVDRHAQKVSAEVLELEEIKSEKQQDKNGYKINSGAKSESRLPAVYRAHHNARILCVMEHPTLKIRQNASLLLDVQYTPSFAISRTPGFGYPLREGIEVSLKCDVDSNPPSTPRWQKDDGDTPVPQTGDGFLNFTSIRREHSGWYKCTSRHLNFQYSSIGYYLSVRFPMSVLVLVLDLDFVLAEGCRDADDDASYFQPFLLPSICKMWQISLALALALALNDSVDVTSEPDDQDVSVAAASHNPNKGQLEVQLGGAVTLQCPQGSLGCWSHLDPVSARLRGLGYGSSQPTGQFSLKDVMYQDAGTYKCVGQSLANKKKLEVLQSVIVAVKVRAMARARLRTWSSQGSKKTERDMESK
ncbi:hypothetical protein ACLKA6_006431 [Drosophila palustris]